MGIARVRVSTHLIVCTKKSSVHCLTRTEGHLNIGMAMPLKVDYLKALQFELSLHRLHEEE